MARPGGGLSRCPVPGKNTIHIDAPGGDPGLPAVCYATGCRPMDVEGQMGDEVQGREVLLPAPEVSRGAGRPGDSVLLHIPVKVVGYRQESTNLLYSHSLSIDLEDVRDLQAALVG